MSRTSACAGIVATALLVAACAADADEEWARTEAEAVRSDRCASARARTTATVKVMTMNLRHDVDQWKRRFELVADEIDRLDPDIIGLQEVEMRDAFGIDFGADQTDALNDLLAKRGHAKYHVYRRHKPGLKGYLGGEGIAIMSRWPIVRTDHEDLPATRVSVFARVRHPSGGLIDMVDTHLDQHGGAEADAVRLEEAKQTVALADRNDGCYATFLTGDMNSGEAGTAVKHFVASGFVDSYRRVHGGETPKTGNTSPIVLAEGAFEQHPRARIDFVLGRSSGGRRADAVDSVVAFRNHDAKGFYPSDHLGVMTTFTVGL
jgi:beta-glucosidase